PKISANFRSDDSIGELAGVSGDTIRNYISLTNLIPELMEMVDEKKIALTPAYQIAALPQESQNLLYDTIESEQATPSLSQAQRIRKLSQSGKLDEDSMLQIMMEQKKPERNDISYAVCQYFGIETADNSFGYIASWSQGKELKEVRASLETINKTSSELISRIEQHYREICKEKGINLEPPEKMPEKPPPEVPLRIVESVPAGIETQQEAQDQARNTEILPLPDPIITPDMMEWYGYHDPNMFPLSKDRALELLEQDALLFMLYPDNTDEMVVDSEDVVNHDGIIGITREEWQDIHSSVPARDVHQRFLDAPGDVYAIMQLKQDAPRELHYSALDRIPAPPAPSNYDVINTDPTVCEQSQMAALERLYEIFNLNRPGDFTGHSLSVSGIVAIKQNGVVSYHHCDSVGFKELPDFQKENYLKAAEMSTEDDYGMIDGIINNGKQPTAAELEQQAKSGQPISLMDLADAVHREKKPSVLEKLKDQPQQPQRKSKPRKPKEQEI
ncbi:MAG: YodL domain-containing protein, partial [Faecousia sp.]